MAFSRNPAAGDAALASLRESRARSFGQLDALRALVSALECGDDSVDRSQLASDIYGFFVGSASNGQFELEENLFPMMREAIPFSALPALDCLLTRLRSDRDRIAAVWDYLAASFEELSQGRAGEPDMDRLLLLVDMFERHIDLCESRLLPLAERLLDTGAGLALSATGPRHGHQGLPTSQPV